MKWKQVDIGVRTADAERVEMRFVGDVLYAEAGSPSGCSSESSGDW